MNKLFILILLTLTFSCLNNKEEKNKKIKSEKNSSFQISDTINSPNGRWIINDKVVGTDTLHNWLILYNENWRKIDSCTFQTDRNFMYCYSFDSLGRIEGIHEYIINHEFANQRITIDKEDNIVVDKGIYLNLINLTNKKVLIKAFSEFDDKFDIRINLGKTSKDYEMLSLDTSIIVNNNSIVDASIFSGYPRIIFRVQGQNQEEVDGKLMNLSFDIRKELRNNFDDMSPIDLYWQKKYNDKLFFTE